MSDTPTIKPISQIRETYTCPWAHEDEIRRLHFELEEAKAEIRRLNDSNATLRDLAAAEGAVDDLKSQNVALLARALAAETRGEFHAKMIDAEKHRADGWKLRWEKAQSQIIRWFQAAGGVK